MRRLTLLFSAAVAALAAGCADQNGGNGTNAAPEACQMGLAASLPLALEPDGYVTTIGMNSHPARMLVDTGSERSVIAGASTKRLGLASDTFNSETVAGIGGLHGAGVVAVNNIQLGDAHGRHLTMLTMPQWNGGDGIDGQLGIDFLEPFDIDLDITGRRIGLYKAVSGCHEPRSAMTGAVYGVELEEDDDADTHVPLVPVMLNGKHFLALLDTGSFHTSMYQIAVRRAGLEGATAIAAMNVRDVGGRKVRAKVVLAPALEIGDLTVRQMPIVVVDAYRHGRADILLGQDFFERVHIWISHSSHTVIMQYPPAATPQPPA